MPEKNASISTCVNTDIKQLHYGQADFLRRSYLGGSYFTYLNTLEQHYSPRTGAPISSYLMRYPREENNDYVNRMEDSTYINMIRYIIDTYESYIISSREDANIILPGQLQGIDFESYIHNLLLFGMILIEVEKTQDGISLTMLDPTHFWYDENDGQVKRIENKNSITIQPETPKKSIFLYLGYTPSLTNSAVYDAAFLNKDHYNRLSLLTYYAHFMTFALLRKQQIEKDDETIELGNTRVLLYGDGEQAPDFISPPTTPSDLLQNYLNHIEELMWKLSGIEGTSDRLQEKHSSLALIIQSQDKFQRINRFSKMIAKAEQKFYDELNKILGLGLEIPVIKYQKLSTEIPVDAMTSKQKPVASGADEFDSTSTGEI